MRWSLVLVPVVATLLAATAVHGRDLFESRGPADVAVGGWNHTARLQAVPWSLDVAVYASALTAVAYCPAADVANWQCRRCDPHLKKPEVMVNDANNLAYITDNGRDIIYVVFRGTDAVNIGQWLNNLDFFRTDVPNICAKCKVHEGIYRMYTKLFPFMIAPLEQRIQKLPGARVYITGHSLGGAFTLIFALYVKAKYLIDPVVYTFGTPRLGNDEFAAFYDNTIPSSYRVNNFRDVVPHVPFKSFGFHHAGKLQYCEKGTQCREMYKHESDDGFLHTSIVDHGFCMGLDFFDFLSTGGQKGCKAPGSLSPEEEAKIPPRPTDAELFSKYPGLAEKLARAD